MSYYRRRALLSSGLQILAFILSVAVVLGAVFFSYVVNTTIEEKEVYVISKERINRVTSTDGKLSTDIENYVYTVDETYKVEDSFWNWHWTSMTVYAQIKEQSNCKLTLAGWRVGFFSMFQNVIKAECE